MIVKTRTAEEIKEAEETMYTKIKIVQLPSDFKKQYSQKDIEDFRDTVEKDDETLVIISDYPLSTEVVIESEDNPNFMTLLKLEDQNIRLTRAENDTFHKMAQAISAVFCMPVVFYYVPK